MCDFTFSTGRPFIWYNPLVEYFKLKIPFIYSSGAIYDPQIKKSDFQPSDWDCKKLNKVVQHRRKIQGWDDCSYRIRYVLQVNDADWETINSLGMDERGKKEDHALQRFRIIKLKYPKDYPIRYFCGSRLVGWYLARSG